MLYICATKFDVTKNFEKLCKIFRELNTISANTEIV